MSKDNVVLRDANKRPLVLPPYGCEMVEKDKPIPHIGIPPADRSSFDYYFVGSSAHTLTTRSGEIMPVHENLRLRNDILCEVF